MSASPTVCLPATPTSTAENVASAMNTTPFGRLQQLPEDSRDVDASAESVEISEMRRPTSPPMPAADWDSAAERRMNAYARERTCTVYMDPMGPAKIYQGVSDSDEVDPNDFPEILFPLQGGGMANYACNATDMLENEDDELKRMFDPLLESHNVFPFPIWVQVDEAQQKDRLVEKFERIYGRWPGPVLFVVNEKMIREAPTFQTTDKCFEDYRLQVPDKTRFFAMTRHIHSQYDKFDNGEMFKKVYTTLALFSDYQFAFLYCRILITRYYDVAFHSAQTLVNWMHIHPDYCNTQTYALAMYDMAARVILMGGDKYYDKVTRMVTSGLYTKPSNRIVAKAAHGLLPPPPKELGLAQ